MDKLKKTSFGYGKNGEILAYDKNGKVIGEIHTMGNEINGTDIYFDSKYTGINIIEMLKKYGVSLEEQKKFMDDLDKYEKAKNKSTR